METRSILESKTFWINVLTIVIAILAITEPGMLGIDPKQLLWISGVANIILRAITSTAVTVPGVTPTDKEV
ncbi:MAG: hypothetical protein KC414_09715 [Romboutsia sp.]|nr:hypothetical protein [Romboutsia sp.]